MQGWAIATESGAPTESWPVPAVPAWARTSWYRWGTVALVALPVVVAVVVASTLQWTPASDWALIELRVRDVGTGATPLVGPFSRFGWNHPGPLLFWVLALPYRLLGSDPRALLVGAGLINLAAVVAIGTQAWRRGGPLLLAWTGLLVALLLHGLGPTTLVDPWNPSIVVLPFLLLVLLTWGVAEGDHRLVLAWVVVASFIVASHVGYVPLVGVLAVAGLGWWWLRRRRTARGAGRWFVAGAVVGALLWAPAVIEQATADDGGNLRQVAAHFLRAGEPTVGPATAAGVFGRHLAPVGTWLSDDEPTQPFTGALEGGSPAAAVPLVVLLGLAAVPAWRRRREPGAESALVLTGLTALVLAAGFVAAARITGEPYPYLFDWLRVLALLVWLSAGWSLAQGVRGATAERVEPWVVTVVAAVTAVVSLTTTVAAIDLEPPLPVPSARVGEVTPAALAAVDGRRVLVWSTGSCLQEVTMGLADRLDAAGVTVVAPPELEQRYGASRVWDGTNADVRLTVACRDGAPEALTAAETDPAVDLVGVAGALTPEEEADKARLADQLRAELAASGHGDLLGDVDSGLILFTGPGAGVDPAVLADYKAVLEREADRYVVVTEPPEGVLGR